ncbi:MAG: hypothetical protein IJV85_01020 [Clostridia bacterium]|nr:hypothetical protein [Clostridia bacterium]
MKKLLTLLILLTTLVFSSCAFPFTQQESSESASSSPQSSSEAIANSSESSEISSLEEPEEEIKVFNTVGQYGRYHFEGIEVIGLDFGVPDELNLDNTRGWIGGDVIRLWYTGDTFYGICQEFIAYKKLEDGSLELVFGKMITPSNLKIIKWEYIPAKIMRIKYYKATDTEDARFVQLDENDVETPVRIGRWSPFYYLTDFDTEPMDGRGIVEEDWEDGQILYASYSATDYNAETDTYRIRGFYYKNPRP